MRFIQYRLPAQVLFLLSLHVNDIYPDNNLGLENGYHRRMSSPSIAAELDILGVVANFRLGVREATKTRKI
jgi:hypothetical protein